MEEEGRKDSTSRRRKEGGVKDKGEDGMEKA
jgi:hypothetical protein